MTTYDAYEMNRKFADSFVKHCIELDISRQELSDACGFSVAIQGKWLQGTCSPGLYALWAMADYMGVSLDELVGREKPIG